MEAVQMMLPVLPVTRLPCVTIVDWWDWVMQWSKETKVQGGSSMGVVQEDQQVQM
jgi:hypothetical protein